MSIEYFILTIIKPGPIYYNGKDLLAYANCLEEFRPEKTAQLRLEKMPSSDWMKLEKSDN